MVLVSLHKARQEGNPISSSLHPSLFFPPDFLPPARTFLDPFSVCDTHPHPLPSLHHVLNIPGLQGRPFTGTMSSGLSVPVCNRVRGHVASSLSGPTAAAPRAAPLFSVAHGPQMCWGPRLCLIPPTLGYGEWGLPYPRPYQSVPPPTTFASCNLPVLHREDRDSEGE